MVTDLDIFEKVFTVGADILVLEAIWNVVTNLCINDRLVVNLLCVYFNWLGINCNSVWNVFINLYFLLYWYLGGHDAWGLSACVCYWLGNDLWLGLLSVYWLLIYECLFLQSHSNHLVEGFADWEYYLRDRCWGAVYLALSLRYLGAEGAVRAVLYLFSLKSGYFYLVLG